MKKLKISFIAISIALIQLTGCADYRDVPKPGKVCVNQGRDYVNHFIDEFANRGVYFSREFLKEALASTKNGINFYICVEGTKHPMAIEPMDGDTNAISVGCSKSAYLSSQYVNYTCPDPAKEVCILNANFISQSKSQYSGAYFPKRLILKILKHKSFSGIVVYIGNDDAKHFPLIMQGTCKTPPPEPAFYSAPSATSPRISKTYCPPICGNL